MSDTSRGPGWWQASDGNWYPPETHPDYRPASSLPPPAFDPPTAQQPVPPMLPPLPTAGTPGVNVAKAKKPWWRRWWAITLAVFIALVILGNLLPAPEDDEEADAAATTEVTTAETTTTTPDTTALTTAPATEPVTAPVTTAPITTVTTTSTTTTTTAAPTTTTTIPPTTTTEFVLTADDVRAFVFPAVFDTTRDGVLDILNSDYVVESVDRYEYDPDSGAVLLDITPAFDFDEGVRDDAWEVMRAMSAFWADTWYDPSSNWSPSLDVSISTAQYRCTGDQMRAMEDARFSRTDWEANCRIR